MKFTAPTRELVACLSTVQRAINKRSPSPLLTGILMEASEGQARFTASNGIMTIRKTIEADVDITGAALVQGDLLCDLARAMSGVDITLISDDRLSMIASGRTRVKLAALDASAYPATPTVDDTLKMEGTIDSADLSAAINTVSYAVSKEEVKQALTAICWSFGTGHIRLVALDGFRLATANMPCSTSVYLGDLLIPGASCQELLKALPRDPCQVYYRIGASRAEFLFANTELSTQLLNLPYIDYKSVIPKGFKTECRVGTDELMAAVERARLVSGQKGAIRLKTVGDSLRVTGNYASGELLDDLEAVVVGENNAQIAFNPVYLLESMKNVASAYAILKFNDATSPAVIVPDGPNDYLHLILPVRVFEGEAISG